MSDALRALLHFFDHDLSWLAQFLSLLVLPFAHEDLAIILGGYIVVNKIMPAGLVALCIYGGMVASDFALYGIGAGARRLPWLTRLAVDDRVTSFGETLKRNLFGLVAFCRVVPGVVFIAFVACGWTRVPLARFTIASFVVSALYLPLMLYLVVVCGDALDDRVGIWAWPFLLMVTTAVGFIRWRVFALQEASGWPAAGPPASIDRRAAKHLGPARGIALARRIPPVLFQLPLVASWIGFAWRHRSLTLPTAANPRIPVGGMWAESKSDRLNDLAPSARAWTADFVVMRRSAGPRTIYGDLERLRNALRDAGLAFPLVAKPDIGRQGQGVRRIDDVQQLREYLRDFPPGARLILQRFLPHCGEATVLYARLPGADSGRILSLSLRHRPHVVGDGCTSVRGLIAKDPFAPRKTRLLLGHDPNPQVPASEELDRIPASGEVVQVALIGSRRARGFSRDACRHITPALEARIDAIASSMTEFHYGRFDLRFASTEALMRAEDFSIFDISGIGAEAIETFDPQLSPAEVYRRLVDRQRILFLIGEKNRARGFEPMGWGDFLRGLPGHARLRRRTPASA